VVERLRAQLADADAALAERDAAMQLLNADKAYLGKELQVRTGHRVCLGVSARARVCVCVCVVWVGGGGDARAANSGIAACWAVKTHAITHVPGAF
jgi:hypothetical protein